METVTSTEVQNRFGEYLEKAGKEAIQITRSGRPAAVMISPQEYAMFQALEDAHWLARAEEAKKEPGIGYDEFMAFVKKRLEELDE